MGLRKLIVYLFFISSGGIGQAVQAQPDQKAGNPTFDEIYPIALRGDLDEVFGILDTLDVETLSDKQQEKRNAFYSRFITDTEQFDYNTNDSLIIRFVDRFHTYWKSVMLGNQMVAMADSLFEDWAVGFLYDNHYGERTISRDSLAKNLYAFSNNFLREKGLYGTAFGKTVHLYDLFLWKVEEVHIYPIMLIDDSVNVTVHFMKDFISTGWSHYATLGRSYTGGWAGKEALYVVEDAYDRQTENFRVSYLAHEGQHFSDYTTFPKLTSADLEYRAKLVELVKSQETTYELIKKFIGNAANTKNNPHAYANYYLINRLSEMFFDRDFVSDIEVWKEIDVKLIRKKSHLLFDDHSKKLQELGSKIITHLITENYE